MQLNRNARAPKLANHGARPCSSVMRRLKKSGSYQKWKEKVSPDAQDVNPRHTTSLIDDDEESGSSSESKPKPNATK